MLHDVDGEVGVVGVVGVVEGVEWGVNIFQLIAVSWNKRPFRMRKRTMLRTSIPTSAPHMRMVVVVDGG